MPRFLIRIDCEITNVCCFKLLSLGVVCYTAVSNKYTGQVWPTPAFGVRKPFVPQTGAYSPAEPASVRITVCPPAPCTFLFVLFPDCLIIRNLDKGDVYCLSPSNPSRKNLNMNALQRCYLSSRITIGIAASKVPEVRPGPSQRFSCSSAIMLFSALL